jgi:hypothetical protein
VSILDWDTVDETSVDREDAALVQRQAAYYAELEQAKHGREIFEQSLASLQVAIDL